MIAISYLRQTVTGMAACLLLAAHLLLPGVAGAASKNNLDKIKIIDSDYQGALGTLTVREEQSGDFAAGESFTLSLPDNADWDEETLRVLLDGRDITSNHTVIEGNRLTIDFYDLDGLEALNTLTVRLGVIGFDLQGELRLTIEANQAGVTPGTLTVARIGGGQAILQVSDPVAQIAEQGYGATLTVAESAAGCLAGSTQQFKLTLPPGFRWGDMRQQDSFGQPLVSLQGGFAAAADHLQIDTDGPRTLLITFTVPAGQGRRGELVIKPLLEVEPGAPPGPVEVIIKGTALDKTEQVIAEYNSDGLQLLAEPPAQLVAGQDNRAEPLQLTVREQGSGLLLPGRPYRLQLPAGVELLEVVKFEPDDYCGGLLQQWDSHGLSFRLAQASQEEPAVIRLHLVLRPDERFSGPLTAVLSGGNLQTEAVIGQVAPPVAAAAAGSMLQPGRRGQSLPAVTLHEGKAGTLAAGDEIWLELPAGVAWQVPPQVSVPVGDLRLAGSSAEDNLLVITVKEAGDKTPAQIQVANILLDIDNSVPEGPLEAQLKLKTNQPVMAARAAGGDEAATVKLARVILGWLVPARPVTFYLEQIKRLTWVF
ncbi:hypothetical protein [Desulforamulus hydrothermalis]|uniref:Uncharacterized protein n=1 Tax=Desulforamulus hydrothermalis Lam5 = DSM 18033 TaxID=1121428 RepID=K8DZL7_9FIRM|nr:hypothetical protein [Desulforamulus hydrothermalis]CCO08445.1 exported hypothetical protein [Desulforamulus hydrothermalis Lam5 = DSM 18033]SHH15575.1 hypothetical protein SAMN02745177_01660 [Desulforamulus hydrothermalis Lam5 = DSM 18033]